MIALASIAALAASIPCAAAQHEHAVTSAEITARPDGLAPQTRTVSLPFRWDHEYPGHGGSVSLRMSLPPQPTDEVEALLISGLGNQATVIFNGVPLARLGAPRDPHYDAAKAGHLLVLPPALSRPGRAQELTVLVTAQRQRGGGLASVQFGRESALARVQQAQQRWRHTSALVYAVSLLLMGGLAAGLWLRQRDTLYGCFSLAALTGVTRNLDRAMVEVPLPWPWWGAIVAVCYACHIALIARFVLLVLDRSPPWFVKGLYGVLGAAVVMACTSFLWSHPMLWTAGLALLQLTAMACWPIVLRQAFIARQPIAWVLLTAGTLAIIAGAHDLILVRMGLLGGASFTLTPHAMFFFVVILAGLVVERYSRAVADYRALNANLANVVAEREAQLRGAFEELRIKQEEQAVLLERQRIMREIHDGVGSQLVGLLNVVAHPSPDREVVQQHVNQALDEMRMAVDSLQPTQDDLTTVLATLRYRVQPRLDAAGIELVWDVALMPSIAMLNAQAALQLQRILLEAFTNVLKHAGATRITMHAQWRDESDPPHVLITLTDNGRGMREDAPLSGGGHGLANMRARAQTIGASLAIRPHMGGTRVMLEWPEPMAEGPPG
ncbi:sensor histidine kinase [Variovorax sp. RT4R15]|uniref:sensor histidine kinase n=1 Tax=Variovorax sp. RT4R15 TaxID=3443737 RepID=UPI003F45E25F